MEVKSNDKRLSNTRVKKSQGSTSSEQKIGPPAVADPGENLTGALHSNFGRGGRGGRG